MEEDSNWYKGEVATQKVVLKALEKGIKVSKPLFDDLRYDLILDEDGKLSRCQVKFVSCKTVHSMNAYALKLQRDRGANRPYTAAEVDVMIVYIGPEDMLIRLPSEIFDGKKGLTIRTAPAKNGQSAGILMAQDYLF